MMRNLFMSEGNIGQEPILKQQSIDGEMRHVLELNVRFNFDRLNKSTGEYEDRGGFWSRVTYWGKRAEVVYPMLKTGMRVLVAGEISQHNYVAESGDRAGQTITATDIHARHLALVLTKSIKDIQFIRSNADDQDEQSED
jgi:single-strand DNA-binding protein